VPPAAESSAAAAPQRPSEAEQIAQLRAELEAMKDRALRYQAELDNYRKRAHRQIEEERRYANLPLMRDLLPVFDNVHRAIAAAENSPEPAGLLAGIKLVAQQLQDVLTRHHCFPIEALHAPFDPHRHQAVAQQPSEEHPANTVLSVTQAGFQLHDRVVRPSQVIVSTTNHANQ
jgi:molecular chaperone GrpE